MMKFKKRFNNISFHNCDKCKTNNYMSSNKYLHECKFVVKTDIYLRFRISIDIKNNHIITMYSYENLIMENCNGQYYNSHFYNSDYPTAFPPVPPLSKQSLNIISQKPQMTQYLSNLIHEVYYTDFYILLLEKHFTFLLIFRFYKPFGIPYDVAKIIAQKILFFLFCFIKQIKN
jgi:hypothetical protein